MINARARDKAVQDAYKGAIDVPLNTARKCLEILKLAKELAPKGLESSASDVGVGALMAHAGLKGAILNVRINLPSITDKGYKAELVREVEQLASEGETLLKEVLRVVEEKI